jgi:hypothetical protein
MMWFFLTVRRDYLFVRSWRVVALEECPMQASNKGIVKVKWVSVKIPRWKSGGYEKCEDERICGLEREGWFEVRSFSV